MAKELSDIRVPESVIQSPSRYPREEIIGYTLPANATEAVARAFVEELQNACLHTLAPPYIYPPEHHESIVLVNIFVKAPIGIAVTNWCTFTIPQDMQGALVAFGQDVNASAPPNPATMWQDIVWTVRKNGNPISAYWQNFVNQRGTMYLPIPLHEFLEGGDVIDVQILNVGAVLYDVACKLVGWQYPSVNRSRREQCYTNKVR